MHICDLHIHSRYSRATSRDCVPEMLELWARRKGIQLIGTGDFTHAAWREELEEKLDPIGNGLFRLKSPLPESANLPGAPQFVLSGEISSIYKQNGKTRKVHNVILLPSLEAARALSVRLEGLGCNLHSDGRPILGLSSRDLLEITLEACPEAIFIPAHIWTPHFSLFGAFSGFDAIEECYGDLTPFIHALETGLSSDPAMNWRLSRLDGYVLVSNSDAHSPSKLGREATLFSGELSYAGLKHTIEAPGHPGYGGTIEFFPEEGKYHFDGHRNCGVCLSPLEAQEAENRCPVCQKPLTWGVAHRVEVLADRPEGYRPENAAPYESLVPLPEILGACMGVGPQSGKVQKLYAQMLARLGPEFSILREAPLEEIGRVAGPLIREGVARMRAGKLTMLPGYDGEYGSLRLFTPEERSALTGQTTFLSFGQPSPSPGKGAANKKAAKKAAGDAPPPALENGSLGELNENQRAAALCMEPAVAVVAGPGTGKTKTLTARIACLIQQLHVPPSEITAVTFTNKAAGEMRARLEKLLPKKTAGKVTIGTFHAICLKLLTKALGGVSLISPGQALWIAQGIVEAQGLSCQAKSLLQAISSAKNQASKEKELPEDAFAAYQESLHQMGALDFDGLLIETIRLFQEAAAPDAKYFTYLLVDEFQDMNPLQFRLLSLWSRSAKSLFVIGDPDQSIYGFRGSSSDCFSQLKQAYPDLKLYRLTDNYRSTPQILRCAMEAIAANPSQAGERALIPHCAPGGKARLVHAASEFEQALFIVKEIGRMVGGMDMNSGRTDRPVRSFRDISVLYRTHRQADMLEKCLQIEGVPYVVAGRDDGLKAPVIVGVLAFFQYAANQRDGAALTGCLESLFACPAKTVSAVQKALSAWDGGGEFAACLPPEIQEERAIQTMLALRGKYAGRKGKPQKLVEDFARDAGIAPSPALERLKELAVLAPDMDALTTNALMGQEGDVVRSGGASYHPDAVTLSTLHGAKGLEFPVVFLTGLRKTVLPLESPAHPADIPEERRLFYVGLTRAKEELVLMSYAEESPFLKELPRAEMDVQAVKKRAPAGKQLSFF